MKSIRAFIIATFLVLASCQCTQSPTLQRNIEQTVKVLNQDASGGSGVIIAPYRVLTCSHVVKGNQAVIVYNGTACKAIVVKRDVANDLLLLKIEIPGDPIKISDTAVKLGDKVRAIGFPFLYKKIVSFGQIGYLDEDSVLHQSPINPGNSGGPLINEAGELIGINSKIMTNTGNFAGIASAIDADTIREFLK